MSDRDRNRPCWCGSGKKWKKCHRNRESQEPLSMWDAEKSLRSALKTKLCLHPEASAAKCSPQIVKAHTVRRAADLKAIERGGHVYSAYVDLATLKRTEGRAVIKPIGINEASTFFGFCSKHDASTFAPLETQPIVPTAEQCFLLTYRPLVKELYLKRAHLATMPIARDTDKGKAKLTQVGIQNFLGVMTEGVQAAIKDLESEKAAFEADLAKQDYSQMRWVVFHLAAPPEIVCSSVLAPRYTFDGRRIQHLANVEEQMQLLSCSLMANGRSGIIVFAWRSNSDRACSELMDSLLALSPDQVPHAITRYVFSEMENLFIGPAWWDSLPEAMKKALEARIAHNVELTKEVSPNYLGDDGVRAVAWQITHVGQHR